MKKYFKGKQYDYRIIIEAIGLYYHFSLSYRDYAKIMRKFSINLHHTTVYGVSEPTVQEFPIGFLAKL